MIINGLSAGGMVRLSGTFTMGSEAFYPEESPHRQVSVGSFLIDPTPVTNRQFESFVEATGYRTLAEIAPDPADYPGMDPALAQAGSLVFNKTCGPVDMEDFAQWWTFTIGADWLHPTGPSSSLDGLEDHPVVHIAYDDALAFAHWVGKELPTEAEFEYAARGGLEGKEYAWGDEQNPGGQHLANIWQGHFPFSNEMLDGWERTSPVRTYPANGYGLFDMIGNVWEWTQDWYAAPEPERKAKGSCCTIKNPRGGSEGDSRDPCSPHQPIPRKVIKGGSHLCAPNYCHRYRPAARQPQPVDTSTSHVGFRCVVRGNEGHAV